MTKTFLITLFVFLLGNFQTFQPSTDVFVRNVPTCEFDFACTADCDPVWWGTAPQFRLICQVVVIDYYNVHYTFLADTYDTDYEIRGIGTGSLVAWRHTWAERIGAVSVYTRPAELQYFPIIY